jgi:CheY-like chemotaxis protein
MAKILLIDDMAGVRKALATVLKMAQHVVTEAEDGITGLSRMREDNFDLVITDIMMPNMDGLEVITHIHAMPRKPPILAISGGGASLPADQALMLAKTRANAVLSKPFENKIFLQIVQQLAGNAAA